MSKQVQTYFDQTAKSFDNIHSRRRSVVGAIVDACFRPGMQERFAYVLKSWETANCSSVLDVGCGGGKYGVELARSGAQVVGVDFAPAMLELAAQRAKHYGVAKNCQWQLGDILEIPIAPADFVLAIGVFDYLGDQQPLLQRLQELTTRELIISFPRASTWQGLLRRCWLKSKNCPVYYYRLADIQNLTAGWPGTVIIEQGIRGDYLFHWRRG